MKMRWKISDRVEKIGRSLYLFCICECGRDSWVRKSSLGNDSFGCKKCSNGMRSHGLSNTKLYHIWSSMKQRCYYSDSISYKNYGGRGIFVCEEWKDSFENFFKWASSSGYKEGLSLERIDFDGNYSPENCKWIARGDQNKNTRSNIFYEKNGERMILKDWCRRLNINYGSVRDRINRGKSIEEAISEPGIGTFKKEDLAV